MISLPPSEFTFGKYGAAIPFKLFIDDNLLIEWLMKQNIIGYCDAMSIEIKPQKDCIAVMIEDEDNWQGWSHIPLRTWKHFLDILNRR